MNRLLMLASTGLFVAGLAMVPVSSYADSNSKTSASTNAGVTATTPGYGAKTNGSVNSAVTKDPSKTMPTGSASVKTTTPSTGASVKTGG